MIKFGDIIMPSWGTMPLYVTDVTDNECTGYFSNGSRGGYNRPRYTSGSEESNMILGCWLNDGCYVKIKGIDETIYMIVNGAINSRTGNGQMLHVKHMIGAKCALPVFNNVVKEFDWLEV